MAKIEVFKDPRIPLTNPIVEIVRCFVAEDHTVVKFTEGAPTR
jgi:hypothetical protein